MSPEELKHLHTAVVDVFSCFLKFDNLKVFCRASGECIGCLLRFLVDESEFENRKMFFFVNKTLNTFMFFGLFIKKFIKKQTEI